MALITILEMKGILSRAKILEDMRRYEGTMTKADLIENIRIKANKSKKDSADMFDTVFSLIKDTLSSGEKIKIAGFGNFEVRQKDDRKGRNPQTGEPITIEARRILTFKPSIVLRQAVNK
jgi:integration host factor subunit alpha